MSASASIPASQPQTADTPDFLAPLLSSLSGLIASLVAPSERLATAIPGLTLVRRIKPTAPSCVTYEPSLALITQGRKNLLIGGKAITYDPSRFLLTSVDLPIISHIPEASPTNPFIGLSLKLDPPMVREVISSMQMPPACDPVNSLAMCTGKPTPQLVDACRRLVALVDKPEEVAVLAGLIQREIIFRLLQSPSGGRLRAITTLGHQSQRTAKAIDWIRTNYNRPLRIEELAELSGMAVSTFHHHFRSLTSMSPIQYQKQLRLQSARGRMLTEGLDAASAAFEVGYESASQFNREYRRMFGQSPVKDVRTLQSNPASPPE